MTRLNRGIKLNGTTHNTLLRKNASLGTENSPVCAAYHNKNTHYGSVIYCIQKYFIIQKSILLCITYDNTCIYNSYLGSTDL